MLLHLRTTFFLFIHWVYKNFLTDKVDQHLDSISKSLCVYKDHNSILNICGVLLVLRNYVHHQNRARTSEPKKSKNNFFDFLKFGISFILHCHIFSLVKISDRYYIWFWTDGPKARKSDPDWERKYSLKNTVYLQFYKSHITLTRMTIFY